MTSCREPTEITLQIRTNEPCRNDKWPGVAVYVGQPGQDLETVAPTLVTSQCDQDGYVGSLVVVPSGSKQSQLGVRVVAGVTRHPEECAAADYAGCIVARRTLRFTPHSSLELPIDLNADCVSVGCDATHTCERGECVDASRTPEPVAPDVAPPSGPTVHCGNNDAVCGTSGDVCCLSVAADHETTHGDCRPAKACPVDGVVLRCDDDTDCPRDPETDAAGVCILSFEGSDVHNPGRAILAQCLYALQTSAQSFEGLTLCQERVPCVDQKFICGESYGGTNPNPLPGYFWCRSAFQ
jgi:hypothetical protein